MEVQNKTGLNAEEAIVLRDGEIASHCEGATTDHRPFITCECARWGSPCPHYFWEEARETVGATDATIMSR